MSAKQQLDWNEANQRYLMTELERVRLSLVSHVESCAHSADKVGNVGGLQGIDAEIRICDAISLGINPPLNETDAAYPLENLCQVFGLSAFERDVLLLSAGVELETQFSGLCAAVHDDPRRSQPTFSMALTVLNDPHWSAVTPAAPLRRWRLIEVGNGETLTLSPLRIDERVLHYLTGLNYLDERLQGVIEPLYLNELLSSSQVELSRRIVKIWSSLSADTIAPLVHLSGEDDASKRAIAAAAFKDLGLNGFLLNARDLPAGKAELQLLVRLWEREAVMNNGVLLVDGTDVDVADLREKLVSFAESIQGLVLVSTRRESFHSHRRATIQLEVKAPTIAEQKLLWEANLGNLAHKLNGQLDTLVTQFNLSAPAIREACVNVLASPEVGQQTEVISKRLWQACCGQARPRLDDLAQRIEAVSSWEELILPDAQRRTLREISTHVRQRLTVYDNWGFATKDSRGLGISVLFAGVSGTGKTMAAEVLARELDLDLYRIDLSSVVSKYIGETEKNLRRVFDAAEAGGAVLLFDEADALFGKRSEVKDSHDRYANIEVSYLLQRMEAYRGLAILTTNMKQALDTAFLRRIRFVVQFPFPDASQRSEIWRRIYPGATPTEALDIAKLSRLNITGGNIRNIAMNAAFLAADDGEPVRMEHLLQAARSEYIKLDKPLTDREVAGWR